MDAYLQGLIEQALEYKARDERVPADLLAKLVAAGVDINQFD
jgi:hypothetical protein